MSQPGEAVTLFRPVGLAELALVYDSGMKWFPPRLPEQPIFYPVLNREYARQIAREWNIASPQSGSAGFVAHFSIPTDFAARFPVHKVGSSLHQELWVSAGQLRDFNEQITGGIHVVEAYFGNAYQGYVPDSFGLREKNAIEQFVCLSATLDYSGMDFTCETAANAKTVYLNYPFWVASDFTAVKIDHLQKRRVLDAIEKLWLERSPKIPLCKDAERV